MDNNNDTSGPSVKFPPPLVFIFMMLAGAGIHYISPIHLGVIQLSKYFGLGVILLGIFIIVLAAKTFKRAKTNIEPWKPTTTIVSSGIFAYSRNPIYIAFCLVTIGIGIFFNSLWIIISFLPSAIIIYYMVIKKEEAYLEEKFDEEYKNYKEKVRRWI